jgi:hypothetical protein
MRRIHTFTAPLVFGVLLVITPKLALGQDEIVARFEARPGTEIQSDQLGEFIAKNLSIKFGTDMRPLSVKLRLEMISRKEGVIGKYESRTVQIEPGKTYPCGIPFCAAEQMNEALAPGFGDRRKITFGRVVVINHEEQYFPRECEGATHTLRVDVGQGDGLMVCLNIER